MLIEVPEVVEMQTNESLLNPVRVFRFGHETKEPVPDIDRYGLDE